MSADQGTNRTKFFYASTGVDWAISDDWHLPADLSRTRTRFRFSQEHAYLLDDAGSYEGRMFDSLTVAVTEYVQAMLQGSFETGPLRHSLVTGVSSQRAQYDVALANYSGTKVRVYWNIYSPLRISWAALADDLKT